FIAANYTSQSIWSNSGPGIEHRREDLLEVRLRLRFAGAAELIHRELIDRRVWPGAELQRHVRHLPPPQHAQRDHVPGIMSAHDRLKLRDCPDVNRVIVADRKLGLKLHRLHDVAVLQIAKPAEAGYSIRDDHPSRGDLLA